MPESQRGEREIERERERERITQLVNQWPCKEATENTGLNSYKEDQQYISSNIILDANLYIHLFLNVVAFSI
jgi:hypothetical protein